MTFQKWNLYQARRHLPTLLYLPIPLLAYTTKWSDSVCVVNPIYELWDDKLLRKKTCTPSVFVVY